MTLLDSDELARRRDRVSELAVDRELLQVFEIAEGRRITV